MTNFQKFLDFSTQKIALYGKNSKYFSDPIKYKKFKIMRSKIIFTNFLKKIMAYPNFSENFGKMAGFPKFQVFNKHLKIRVFSKFSEKSNLFFNFLSFLHFFLSFWKFFLLFLEILHLFVIFRYRFWNFELPPKNSKNEGLGFIFPTKKFVPKNLEIWEILDIFTRRIFCLIYKYIY